MSDVDVQPAIGIQGQLELPGDKSVSHRALLLGLLGTRPQRVQNLALSDDVASTLRVVEQLGATVERDERDPRAVTITGVGLRGIRPPEGPVDAGNAGTLARLLAGILADQEGTFTIVGDESLSGRPMTRIVEPLRKMGADIETAPGGTLPLTIHGRGGGLRGIDFELPVASAQVQSAVLLAGLFAEGTTTVHEPGVVRDHTERMLGRAGVPVRRSGRNVTVEPVEALEVGDTTVPADPSAAAPFVTAATVLRESFLLLPAVLASPGRIGYVEHLQRMGARIGMADRRHMDGEPVADIEVRHGDLRRQRLDWEDVPRMIDELPFLALAAQFCRGETFVKGAEELRVKESDRIESTVQALHNIGVAGQELRDGFIIRGSGIRPNGGEVHAEGDHRIAMLGGIAGLVSRHGVTVRGADCVAVSYPNFFEVLERLAVR